MWSLFLFLISVVSATPADDINACVAQANDPAAFYTVSDDTTTLYSGADLGGMLAAASTALALDPEALTFTTNTEGRSAFIDFHTCTADQDVVHGVVIWANSAGAIHLFEHDIVTDSGAVYTLEEFHPALETLDENGAPLAPSNYPVFSFQADPAGAGCDSIHKVGVYVLGNQPVVLESARPARPEDPGFKNQGCIGDPCSACALMYNMPSDGNSPYYSCACRTGGTNPAYRCNHFIDTAPGKTNSWDDGNNDGIGDGGIW